MNAVSAWDQSRWRDADAVHLQYAAPSHPPPDSPPTGPQGSATAGATPEAAGQASQHIILNSSSYPPLCIEKPHPEGRPRPSRPSDTYSDASHPYINAHGCPRHALLPNGGERGEPPATTHSPPTAWRSDRPSSSGHLAAAPLTLHIPHAQDLPGKGRNFPAGGYVGYHSPPGGGEHLLQQQQQQQQQMSTSLQALPSFASLNEHTGRGDDVEGSDVAPMSSRITCYLCNKLKPMVKEMALAVAELDENVQLNCNKAMTRPVDFPGDSPVRTVQWILDRLRYAKVDLQDYRRSQPGLFYSPQSAHISGVPARSTASPNQKRPGERWDRDDSTKRPRVGEYGEYQYQSSTGLTPRENCSLGDFDTFSGSHYPKSGSPTTANRTVRPLPSPSSTAYPPSAAPTHVQSGGSPRTPFQATTLHAATTNSATSAHIADLQHQVTLKSLALQTLQAEYASLLQKLQRERVKSQTIEKKTSVADQEVNDLTTRIDELNDQLRTCENQLEESERKRELDRAEMAKEKDQWSRMLEMGGRLHTKGAEERQKLIEEKNRLAHRLALLEGKDPEGTEQSQQPSTARSDGPRPATEAAADNHPGDPNGAYRMGGEAASQEIRRLQARVEALTTALNEVKQHSQELDAKAHDSILQHGKIRDIVDCAVQHQKPPGSTFHAAALGSADDGQRQTPTMPAPPALSSLQPPSQTSTLSQQHHANVPSGVPAANLARTASPTPADLGFSIRPTTSSPEELIQALGPVPASSNPLTGFSASGTWESGPYSRYAQAPPHHVPRPGYADTQARPPGSSPQSYHSSPGGALDRSRSSSGSERRVSSEGYASEPDPSQAAGFKAAPRPEPAYMQADSLHGYDPHRAAAYGRDDVHVFPHPRPSLSRYPSASDSSRSNGHARRA